MSSVRPMSTFPPLSPDEAVARVHMLGRSLVVALADDAFRAQQQVAPVLTVDDFAQLAREVGHYAALLLERPRPFRWCHCGDELVSVRDLQTGSCRWCRADEDERAALRVADPPFAVEVAL
jgi:hypothetical protein